MKSKSRAGRTGRVPVDPELVDRVKRALNKKRHAWGASRDITLTSDLVEYALLRLALNLTLEVNPNLCRRYEIGFYDDDKTAGKPGLFPSLPGETKP